ncbi:MAG: VWA domain-containing protein [Planctomycetes bacterium]|nr:VWA domain-containing protein [Planctomycetota bacterium]MCC7172311.1 VWA domain-containing protein [Planctomycetota bacterium]
MSLRDFRFQDPLWLLALVPVLAVFVGMRVRARRGGSAPALIYSSRLLFDAAPRSIAQRIKAMLPYVQVLGCALVILALARPQQGRAETRITQDAIAIQMVVDRSGSMEALDFVIDGERRNRLDIVKRVFKRFVFGDGDRLKGRHDDLIGLIVFGGYPETRCPLTFDHEALAKIVDDVEVPGGDPALPEQRLDPEFFKEERATAIGDALAVAVDRLAEVAARSRIAILLSDGDQTAGTLSPEQAAAVAKKAGIRVYTIAIGTNGLAPVPIIDTFGRRRIEQFPVTMNETTLREIASATDGKHFTAQDTESLIDVYATIDELERTRIERSVFTRYDDRAWFVLVPGVLLLALHVLLVTTRFAGVP